MQSVQRTTKSSTWAAGTNQKLVQWWQMCAAPCTALWGKGTLSSVAGLSLVVEQAMWGVGCVRKKLLSHHLTPPVPCDETQPLAQSSQGGHGNLWYIFCFRVQGRAIRITPGTSEKSSLVHWKRMILQAISWFLQGTVKKQNPNKLPVCKIGL